MLTKMISITISSNTIAFLLLHHLAIFSKFCEASSFDNVTDKLALLDIKSHLRLQYSDDDVFSSWNESVDFCLWKGVECSKTHHRVVGIDLKRKNLYGNVAPSFGNLSFLHDLDLSLNSLTGLVPSELGRLTRLKSLNLSFNSLSGAIPVNLSSCSDLISISLTNNLLNQPIPWEFGTLLKLETLHLYSNNLTGNFPSSLGNLTSLKEFDVSYNLMGGEIPNTIGEMKNLKNLLLGINHFSGVFPPAIYNLSSLTLLALTDNKFHGSLRSDIGFLFPKIEQLWLGTNNFTGHIPVSLSNVTTLAGLDLPSNRFSGNIPSSFANLQNLSYLYLYYNYLGNYGDDDLLFLESLANCSSLQTLDVSWNLLGGELRASVSNLSSQLEYFSLEGNYIDGSIPEEISGLIGLTTLSMRANLITGNIPASVGAFPLLQVLYLDENYLTGEIPYSVGNLTQLLEFYVNSNTLQGSLPSTFSNLKQLHDASFCDNKLNGTIPPELVSLPSLTLTLNLSHNVFTGPLPDEVGNLTSLTSLDVSYNNLSGDIPSNLGLCLSLTTLNMQNNIFGGSVPDLSRLQGLEYLDLSRNNLTGTIPGYFGNFPSLLNLNISYNNFQGQVPVEGVFMNETAVQVNDNNNLCGGIPQFNLRPCHPVNKSGRSSRHVNLKLIVPLGLVSFCVLLLLLLFAMLFLCRKKTFRGKHRSKSSLGQSHLRISYKELYDATGGFSSDALIGAGSFGTVYKGVLGEGEIPVAIKVLNLHQQGASRSFEAECEALGNIRHKNLMKIITVCSGVDYNGSDFKALMYPYMSNGSLDKWIHQEHGLSSNKYLNIHQRVNIAIDIASALEYLHHGNQIPIVHCDLKPSNVLLDSDLTARVGDFGLARLLLKFRGEENLNQFSSLGIKGTFGYIAPEYGMGSPLSTAGDVYSYGILLLEMFTGRRPVDGSFQDNSNSNSNLHNLVKQAMPDNVVKIIDQSALYDHDQEVKDDSKGGCKEQHMKKEVMIEWLVPILEIGIACSAENPQDRMNMTQAVHKLVHIKGEFFPDVLK